MYIRAATPLLHFLNACHSKRNEVKRGNTGLFCYFYRTTVKKYNDENNSLFKQ